MLQLTFVDDDGPRVRWHGGSNGYVDQFDEWVKTSGWTYEATVRIPERGRWDFAIKARLQVHPRKRKAVKTPTWGLLDPTGDKPGTWVVSLEMGHNTRQIAEGSCRTLKDARDQAAEAVSEGAIDAFVSALYRDRSQTTCLYRYTGPSAKIPYDRVREEWAKSYTARWEAANTEYYAEILQSHLWEPFVSYLGVIKYRGIEFLPHGLYLEIRSDGVSFIDRMMGGESSRFDSEVSRFGRTLKGWVSVPEDPPSEQP